MLNNYRYFSNKECEFFPCHPLGTENNFNCLFCFCPLYTMSDCGGTYTYTSEGKKDCSNCIFPHLQENYGKVLDKLK